MPGGGGRRADKPGLNQVARAQDPKESSRPAVQGVRESRNSVRGGQAHAAETGVHGDQHVHRGHRRTPAIPAAAAIAPSPASTPW